MATRKKSGAATTSAKTSAKTAGKPVQESATRSRRVLAGPSKEDLDLRDRLKAQPRRPAGPPLVGDVMTRAAMEALRNEVVPEPTDPKNRKGRG